MATVVKQYRGYDIYFDGSGKFYIDLEVDGISRHVEKKQIDQIEKLLDARAEALPVLIVMKRNAGYWKVSYDKIVAKRNKYILVGERGQYEGYMHEVYLPTDRKAAERLSEITSEVYKLHQEWEQIVETLSPVTASNLPKLQTEWGKNFADVSWLLDVETNYHRNDEEDNNG